MFVFYSFETTDFALEEHEAVLLHKAARLQLSFIASETSEVVGSAWAIMMITFFYFGPNKEYFYVIRNMDDAGFWKAFQFCMLDAVMELLSFIVLGTFIRIQAGLHLLEVGLAYVRNRELFTALLVSAFLPTVGAFSFFIIHFGVDPTFQFDYDGLSGSLTHKNATCA